MSLAADLGAPAPYHGTKPCSFGSWLSTLEPADAAAVRAAVARRKGDPLYWSMPDLQRRLRAAGWTGSEAVVYNHRNDECMTCRSQTS